MLAADRVHTIRWARRDRTAGFFREQVNDTVVGDFMARATTMKDPLSSCPMSGRGSYLTVSDDVACEVAQA